MAQHAAEIGAFGIGAMASPFPKPDAEELVKYEEIACGAPSCPSIFIISCSEWCILTNVALLESSRRQDSKSTGLNIPIKFI